MHRLSSIKILVVCAALALGANAMAGDGADVTQFKVRDIDGKDVDMGKYKGKVLMIVNVASKCGLTPQYKDLVEIHQKYKDQGFQIVGFPANDFMSQEPGTNGEIKEFCSANFNVEFDLMSKISVKDPEKAPLYKALTSEDVNGAFGGEIKWNFTKFIVGKDGKVAHRIEPRTRPNDASVAAMIEKELAK